MYEKYNWRFNEEVTKVFDEHVNKSVPMYQLFHDSIANMSVYFTNVGTNIIDIGTSTGALINKIKEINQSRKLKYIGIDIEESMINECNKRYDDIEFKLENALNCSYKNSSVVTCMLSLQFMQKQERVKLIQKIYDEINDDGALFVVEKIKTDILDIHDIYNDLYYDFKRINNIDKEILDKNASLRGIMKPITLKENIELLNLSGFKKVDIFLKYNNFVGIVAIK